MSDAFAPHIEAVARKLCGEPNRALSSKTELRFGSQGSLSVDLDKGTFFDHESGKGGGVLALVERETGHKNGFAVTWLRDELGADIPDNKPQAVSKAPPRLVATYDYPDEHGEIVFQVCRYEPKDFRQRKPKGEGWDWSIKGVRQVPYRLPDVLRAIADGQTIYIAEGEKDVDALWREGIAATTNAGGSGKWPEGLSEHFAGADVVILPDNDEAGRKHAANVCRGLQHVAKRVRVLELPGLPPKGDPSDWLAEGGDAEQLHELAFALAKDWTPTLPESAFGAITWEAMDDHAIRQDWLVEDMLFCGDMALIYGASASGKSFLTVDMGLSIARGVPFLGKPTRKGLVIYQAGEGGKGLLKRLRAYRQHHKLFGERLPFVLLPSRVDLFASEGDAERLVAECRAWERVYGMKTALLIIDTLSTATPGANENASEDMSRPLKAGAMIQEQLGSGMAWVHHKNAAGDRERGHTSLRANSDTALEVNRDPETNFRTLRVVKVKDGEDGEIIGFQLQSLEIGTYDSGKSMTSCVVLPAEVGPQGTGDRTSTLSNAQYIFLSCLDDAIDQRGGILPPTLDQMNTRGCQWREFRDIYKAVRGNGMEPDALRKALSRDGDALHAKGLIGASEPWVWITNKGQAALKGRRG